MTPYDEDYAALLNRMREDPGWAADRIRELEEALEEIENTDHGHAGDIARAALASRED
jgi:hypothetical protein